MRTKKFKYQRKYKSVFEITDITGGRQVEWGIYMTTNLQLKFQNYKFLGVNVPKVSEEKTITQVIKKRKKIDNAPVKRKKGGGAKCPGD